MHLMSDTIMHNPLKHIPAFLATVRSALSAPPPRTNLAWVVLGNESADLDSAISSLLYAYALSLPGPQLAAPILPILRADIVLRTEITAFLASLGLDPVRDLFFVDDLNKIFSSSASSTEKPKVVLADFNALPPSLAHLHPHVSAILDHHVDSGHFPNASPRVIEPVGSATSLVIRECFSAAAAEGARAEIARLALGPILLDTIHLNRAMHRTTNVDEAAVALCQLWLSPTPVDTSLLYKHLLKAKVDISHLTTPDLLRKDYKEFELLSQDAKYGMASVMLDLHQWIRRDGSAAHVLQQAREFASARNLHSLYILTAFEDQEGGFHRQLAVVFDVEQQEEAGNRVVEALKSREEAKGLQVQEAKEQVGAGSELVVYDVGKHVSRKVLQPLLHQVLTAL